MKTVTAFSITVAVALPATLVADVQVDGPEIRPAQQTVKIGDASVSFDVDRGVMLEGETVSAVLVATSARAHDVVVDVDALEDMGFGEERVPNPAREAGSRTLTLHARPGGGPPVVASFKLGSRRAPKGSYSWYDLHVHAHGLYRDDEAVAGIATFSGNPFAIAIEPPVKIPAKGPFTMAVRIKNTTKLPWDYAYVDLGSALMEVGLDGMQPIAKDFDAQPVDGQRFDEQIAPGAEKLVIYKIKPHDDTQQHFSFVAFARTSAREALEVRTFDRSAPDPEPDSAPHPVATR